MKENIQTNIGKQIRKFRRKNMVSLRDFEIMTGISRANLSKIETGKQNSTIETLRRIAGALNCDIKVLLTEKK